MSLTDPNSQYEEVGPGQNSSSTINAGHQNDGYEQPVNNPNNVTHEYEDVQGATGRVRDGVRHKK